LHIPTILACQSRRRVELGLLGLLRRFGLRQTFFVPGWCVERYPRAVEAILADGHELGHHGYMHEKLNQLSRDEERAVLHRAMETIVNVSGQRPRGFRAPSYWWSCPRTSRSMTGRSTSA
jgi:peptidoglycan-N-acetylglucosamine deacetylase